MIIIDDLEALLSQEAKRVDEAVQTYEKERQ